MEEGQVGRLVQAIEDMGQMGKVVHELRSGPASSALAGQRSSIWPSREKETGTSRVSPSSIPVGTTPGLLLVE